MLDWAKEGVRKNVNGAGVVGVSGEGEWTLVALKSSVATEYRSLEVISHGTLSTIKECCPRTRMRELLTQERVSRE